MDKLESFIISKMAEVEDHIQRKEPIESIKMFNWLNLILEYYGDMKISIATKQNTKIVYNDLNGLLSENDLS